MTIKKADLQAGLDQILNTTCDGDHRAKARNYIVKIALNNLTDSERIECEQFIDEALHVIV